MSILQSFKSVRVLPVFVFTAITIFSLSASAFSNPPGIGNTIEEIEKLAMKEGKVMFASAPKIGDARTVLEGWYKKYPQIKVEYTQIMASRVGEKMFTEALSGVVEYDLVKITWEYHKRFIDAGLLAGPLDLERIFPAIPKEHFSSNGYFAGSSHAPRVIAYNTALVPPERVPRTWEDCLDPYWKGKIATDVRPTTLVFLSKEWGEKRVLEFAEKLKEQNPIWRSGLSQAIAMLAAGDFPLIFGSSYAPIVSLLIKDPQAKVRAAFPNVAPAYLNDTHAIFKGAKNPNAAFLLQAWLASGEGNMYLDEVGRGSPFIEGTSSWKAYKEAGSKAISVPGWDLVDWGPELQKKIVSVLGFPTATK